MELEKHVLSAIEDYSQEKLENALMHACIAIDATARGLYGKKKATRHDYKNCLRAYYWIIEPMIGAGLNLEETKWNNLEVLNGDKRISNPDLADVIYHIFRCNHSHAEPVPKCYDLLPTRDGLSQWIVANNV